MHAVVLFVVGDDNGKHVFHQMHILATRWPRQNINFSRCKLHLCTGDSVHRRVILLKANVKTAEKVLAPICLTKLVDTPLNLFSTMEMLVWAFPWHQRNPSTWPTSPPKLQRAKNIAASSTALANSGCIRPDHPKKTSFYRWITSK